VHSLKVGHMNRAHDAGHLGAQRRKIAADVSIISYLFDLAALPRIPVASDGDEKLPGRALQQGVESRTVSIQLPAKSAAPQRVGCLQESDKPAAAFAADGGMETVRDSTPCM